MAPPTIAASHKATVCKATTDGSRYQPVIRTLVKEMILLILKKILKARFTKPMLCHQF
jgi:hypothetical protein